MRDAPKKNQVFAQDASTAVPPAPLVSESGIQENNGQPSPSKLIGRSLMVFGPQNQVRMFLARIVRHRRFEHIIIILIVCSSIVLAMDSPSVRQGSTLHTVLVRFL